MSAPSDTTPEARHAHVQSYLSSIRQTSPIYGHLFPSAVVTSTSPGRVLLRVPVEPQQVNTKGSLHGAVSAALVDLAGGLAIAAHDCRGSTGVSTDMHISFAGGARAGDALDVEGRVDKCGATLAFTTVTVCRVEEGKGVLEGALVSKGQHTKFVR